MNCICCIYSSDCFSALPELLKKSDYGDNVTFFFKNKSQAEYAQICGNFESCILVTDICPDRIEVGAEKAAVIMPHEFLGSVHCKAHSFPLITLGWDSRATLCCSSSSQSNTLISLQRSITSFSGFITEPREFVLPGCEAETQLYAHMALLAVKLLTGKYPDKAF